MQLIPKHAGAVIYKTAAMTVAALIAFFIIVKVAGWAHVVQLRYINFVIMALGIRHVLRVERKADHDRLEYLTGLMYGAFTSLLVSLPFAGFLFFYLAFADPALMQQISESVGYGDFLNPLSASLVVFVEGLASGVVLSYLLIRIMKHEVPADL